MSISTLFNKNNFDINCKTLNGIKQIPIGISNVNNQVLTLIDKDEKIVAFADAQGGGLPSTTEYPNGYVLKILDNIENTYTWAQDSTGGTVPLILTGQSPTALQVKSTPLATPSFTVNTVFNRVDINDPVLIKGDNSTAKLKVENATLNKNFIISTDPLSQPITNFPAPIPIYSLVDAIGGESNYVGSIVKNNFETVALLAHQDEGALLAFDTTNTAGIVSNDKFSIKGNSIGILTNNTEGAEVNINIQECRLVSPKTANSPHATLVLKKPAVINPATSNGEFIFSTSAFTSNNFKIVLGENETTLTTDKILRIDAPTSFLYIGNNSTQQNIEMKSVQQIYVETPDFFVDTATKVEFASAYIVMGAPLIEFTTAPKTLAPAVADDELVQKLYVDTRDGYLFSSISNSSTANQVFLTTNLLDGTPSAGSTLLIPANGFVVGDSFHLDISGSCNFNGNPPNASVGTPTALNITLTLVASGSGTLATLVIPTRNTGASSFFECEADFTVRSTGATGSIATSFEFTYQIPSTTSFEGSRNTTIGLLNTTVSNTLSCIASLQVGYLTAEITGFMANIKKTH